MTLIVLAHRDNSECPRRADRLSEAARLLQDAFDRSVRVGRHSESAAGALLFGLVHALRGDQSATLWFAQAVTLAATARQMETLWRAHLNLANSFRSSADGDLTRAGDHARACLEILQDSLAQAAEPERTPRFALVFGPLAQSVGHLIAAKDKVGFTALERYPTLKDAFQDIDCGLVSPDRGGWRNHEWLRIGLFDFVLY